MWPQTDSDPAEAEPRTETCPRADTFVIIWDDDTAQVQTERYVSQMYDMADTGTLDGMLGVYVPREGVLCLVRLGRRVETGESTGPYYATSPLLITVPDDGEGTDEVVGTVHWTDH